MKKQILAALLALSLAPAAFAQSAPPSPQQGNPAAWQQQREQHLAERANRLAQKLGLDQAAAQRFQRTFEDFASRRQALGQQFRSINQTLRAAAQGDANAANQVEGAIDQLRSLRSQMNQLQDDLFNQLSSGLNEQQKAKLVLAVEHAGMHGRFGMHGPHGQSQQQQPQQPAQNP